MNNTEEFELIIDKLETIEAMLKKLTDKKDVLKSDDLMDNADMCRLFGIAKRTLQRYRQKGVVPYYRISGVTYYKPDEVKESLKRIMNDRKSSLKPENQ